MWVLRRRRAPCQEAKEELSTFNLFRDTLSLSVGGGDRPHAGGIGLTPSSKTLSFCFALFCLSVTICRSSIL